MLAAAYHALASVAADRASHWAAMPNHQPSCFALSKLPCVAKAYYSFSNQTVWMLMELLKDKLGVDDLSGYQFKIHTVLPDRPENMSFSADGVSQ